MGYMKLQGNEDNYEIDEIDCFEKPFGIVLDGMKKGYSNLFYMFLKMVQAYNIKEYLPIAPKSTIETEMFIKHNVLQKEFNITIHRVECDDTDRFHSLMEEILEGPNVILIPGSLKELYYSKYYKRRNWPHLFLIKSYDKENELYYTLDSSQFYKENMALYRDFVIPYDIMKSVHFEYKNDYYPYIYYINVKEKNITNENNIVKSCVNLYLNKRIEQPYREVTYISSLFEKKNSADEVTYYSQKLFRTNKAKKIFLKELEKYLQNHNYDQGAFQQLSERLCNEWKKQTNICVVHARKGQDIDVSKALYHVMELEESLYEEIGKVHEFLISNGNACNSDNNSMFENNAENIIRSKDDGYIFDFPKGKVYTSWFKDDSPKVVIRKNDNEQVYMRCTVDVQELKECSNFHAGIFMRTNQGYVYFWGTHCCNVVRLDLSGIDTDLYSYDHNARCINLFIRLDGKRCSVGIIEDSHENVLNESELVGNIYEIGVGCKTWDESDEVKIIFKNIAVQNEERLEIVSF